MATGLHKLFVITVLLLTSAVCTSAEDETLLRGIGELEDTIESLALAHGPFSQDLFDPLMELARLQLEFDNVEDAEDSLRRAQNIAHRNEGVYTTKQLEIIDILTNLALASTEYQDANQQQKFAFFVAKHAFEENDPEVLSAYIALANWYMYTGQPRRARNLIKDGRKNLTRTGQDLSSLVVLENRARRLEGICCNPKRLIASLNGESRETSAESLAALYLEIADTLTLGGRAEDAAEYFRRAHETTPLNDAEPEPLSIRRTLEKPMSARMTAFRVVPNSPMSRQHLERMTRQEQLEEPTLEPHWFIIDADGSHKGFATLDSHESFQREKRTTALVGSPILFSEDQLNQLLPLRLEKRKETLKIEVSFTVTETGNLEEIEVIESNAPLKLDRLISNALRKVYFRPALEAGVPVLRKSVTLTQTFKPRGSSSL